MNIRLTFEEVAFRVFFYIDLAPISRGKIWIYLDLVKKLNVLAG